MSDRPAPSGEARDHDEGFIHFEVGGKTDELWGELRKKFIKALHALLDSTIDFKRRTTVREEAKEFSSALLEYARQKLAKAGYENVLMDAQVQVLYAEREKKRAETRKVDAEARAIEHETAVKELKHCLMLTKAMLIGEDGQEALLLGKQVGEFLETIKEIESEVRPPKEVSEA